METRGAFSELSRKGFLMKVVFFQVYFPNAKEAEFQYVTVPNLLLSIKPLGQILYMLRFQLNCLVLMHYGFFYKLIDQ